MKPARRTTLGSRTTQQGVVMLFGLLALVIMMIGAVAMIRSMNTSLFNAGNLGFKRDLTNQGERATAIVLDRLGGAGALSTEAARRATSPGNNYSAILLPNNAQGMPQALTSDALFAAAASAGNDIVDTAQGITVRYVLDRMCTSEGVADASRCTMSDAGLSDGRSSTELDGAEYTSSDDAGRAGAVAPLVVYRLSIRVTGPRSTQAFFQTTLIL
jgi:type IV pilus assembly protein PilX